MLNKKLNEIIDENVSYKSYDEEDSIGGFVTGIEEAAIECESLCDEFILEYMQWIENNFSRTHWSYFHKYEKKYFIDKTEILKKFKNEIYGK